MATDIVRNHRGAPGSRQGKGSVGEARVEGKKNQAQNQADVQYYFYGLLHIPVPNPLVSTDGGISMIN